MQDGDTTGKSDKQIWDEYQERGKRLANMLAAHVRESKSLCATFSTCDPSTEGTAMEGTIEYVVVIARQYPFETPPPPTEST